MCGIIAGITNEGDIKQPVLSQLKKLEYRGYDSAGIATITDHQLHMLHSIDSIDALTIDANIQLKATTLAIAHTRWATHGAVTLENAHPHIAGNRIALVHNGIIENYNTLKESLENMAIQWRSTTDSEVIAQLIYQQLKQGVTIENAIEKTIPQLKGTYALAIIDLENPDKLFCIAKESSLILGKTKNSVYLSSDLNALVGICEQACQVPQGQLLTLQANSISPATHASTLQWQQISDITEAEPEVSHTHETITHKEIGEQPAVLNKLINTHCQQQDIQLPKGLQAALQTHQRIKIIACGSSYYSACVGKYWIEDIAGMPVTVELASEIRYRNPVIEPHTLLITLSQSGETLDTISAQRYILSNHPHMQSLSIGNNALSTLASESTFFWPTLAGAEIGVATTKVFTAQLFCLASLCCALCQDPATKNKRIAALSTLPEWITQVLAQEPIIKRHAQAYQHDAAMIFCARGSNFPIAEEAALKLKELAYIHASAYAAGELKHGPLALIEENLTSVFFINEDKHLAKTRSNIHEVLARKGKILLMGSQKAFHKTTIQNTTAIHFIATTIESPPEEITPFTNVIGAQLLTYHIAKHKNCAIDKPRNLAKCVTVE